MLLVNKRLPGGQGLAASLLRRAATVTLDWDIRQKSRFDCTDSAGRHLGVFMPRGTSLRGGDVLVAEDGSLLRVIAAPQPVLRVRPGAGNGGAFELTRAAYHLGNRHVALELRPEWLQLEPDHVLADMLRAMHLEVQALQAPFEPEGGAYGGGHGQHAPGHAHDHPHEHAHDHEHTPPPHDHGNEGEPHEHDDGTGHEHPQP